VPTSLFIAACLVVLIAMGALERLLAWRARRALPVRIHVNGTRGKSTVTRLIVAALREAGVPTLGKVTGTLPRLLWPDGSERPVRRRGPANVREQMQALRLARRLGVRALVVECMAVRPDLQWTAEQHMIQATIGVMTNVRLDHREVMGRNLEDIARSLSNTIPAGTVAIVGDTPFLPVFEKRAAAMRARIVVAQASGGDHAATEPAWLHEDRALALAVTRELGIPDAVALAGMARALSDPGTATLGTMPLGNRTVARFDAAAANDPQSFDQVLASSPVGDIPPDRRLIVYNHRADRPERLRDFLRDSASIAEAAEVVVTGDRPPWLLWRQLGHGRPRQRIRFSPLHQLGALQGPEGTFEAVVFCGNTRGLMPEAARRTG
jgi:poly-gamma-glutamate synthase PgsB/CapB